MVGVLYVYIIASISLAFEAPRYSIHATKEGVQIMAEDFGSLLIPGKPMLPMKRFLIGIPPTARNVEISFHVTSCETIGKYYIKPAPMQLPKGIWNKEKYEDIIKKQKEIYQKNYQKIYETDKFYPAKIVEYEGVKWFGRWKVCVVKYCPFQWNPISKILILHKKIQLNISFNEISKGSPEYKKMLKLIKNKGMDAFAKDEIINYKHIAPIYEELEKELNLRNKRFNSFAKEGQRFQYLVIIPNENYFWDCAGLWKWCYWKDSLGDTTFWITMHEIIDSFSGRDIQEKIRNAIKYYYNEGVGLKYVLLVGDIDSIPMRYCYPFPDTFILGDHPIPTDFYYADLTGNWDSDGDGRFGEWGQDSVDFLPEVIVGRIPFNDTSAISSILLKSIKFEKDTLTSYKKNALMCGAVTFLPPTYTDEADIMEQIYDSIMQPDGWTYNSLYEKGGIAPSQHPCSDSLTYLNVLKYWCQNKYGYVNFSAHGSPVGVYRTIWINDYNNNDTAEASEQSQPPFFDTCGVWYLDNNFPSIVYASACLTLYPEVNSLGKCLLLNGAVAYIGASRPAYGPWGHPLSWLQGGNTGLNYLFTKYLIKEKLHVGAALSKAKLEYYTKFTGNPTDFQNLYCFNLFGDPALNWLLNVTAVKELKVVKCKLHLMPNPVRGKLKIDFILPQEARVKITIFDVCGRKVANIMNDVLREGRYFKEIKIKFPAGIYFLRIEINNKEYSTRKFVVIK